jgi:hypothetical protein
MNPWAQERAPQLDTPAMTAFGIRIASRHADAQEMAELIAFARAAACANVNMFVTEAFYDSRASCCHFTLSPLIASAGAASAQALLDAALQTISQFQWQGLIHHGRAPADHEAPL